ncbi:MAG: hypothetical protein JNN11_04070 [Candidatus Doudnabacteria bacterium]|nr:hypothetical protein [Candidatus Doudnabacteria bacterium]
MSRFERFIGLFQEFTTKEAGFETNLNKLSEELKNIQELLLYAKNSANQLRLNNINEQWAHSDHNPMGHLANMAGPGADRKINPRIYIFTSLKNIFEILEKIIQHATSEKFSKIFENFREENSKMFFLQEYLTELEKALTLLQSGENKSSK